MTATDLFGARRPVDAWAQGLDPEAVPLAEQLACVRRELALRRKVYTQRVRAGLLAGPVARRELEAMTAVLRTLARLERAARADQALGAVLAASVAGGPAPRRRRA